MVEIDHTLDHMVDKAEEVYALFQQTDLATSRQALPGLTDPHNGAYPAIMDHPECIAAEAGHVWIDGREHGAGGEHRVDGAAAHIEHAHAGGCSSGVRGTNDAAAGFGQHGRCLLDC